MGIPDHFTCFLRNLYAGPVANWLSEEALQIAEERRKVESKGEGESYIQLNAEFQNMARRHKKAFFSEQWVKLEENSRRGKTRDLFKKIGNIKGWAQ